jgi:hypothetical protein
MKLFEIWAEGYVATGEHQRAIKLAEAFAETFDDAVKHYMDTTHNHDVNKVTRKRYTSEEAYQNRRSNWEIWGCMLFDNEADARKSFG